MLHACALYSDYTTAVCIYRYIKPCVATIKHHCKRMCVHSCTYCEKCCIGTSQHLRRVVLYAICQTKRGVWCLSAAVAVAATAAFAATVAAAVAFDCSRISLYTTWLVFMFGTCFSSLSFSLSHSLTHPLTCSLARSPALTRFSHARCHFHMLFAYLSLQILNFSISHHPQKLDYFLVLSLRLKFSLKKDTNLIVCLLGLLSSRNYRHYTIHTYICMQTIHITQHIYEYS